MYIQPILISVRGIFIGLISAVPGFVARPLAQARVRPGAGLQSGCQDGSPLSRDHASSIRVMYKIFIIFSYITRPSCIFRYIAYLLTSN